MRREWLALALAACAGPAPGSQPVPLASLEVFRADVQPHLGERCASGGCHGRADRPLSLFAPGVYRRDAERTYLDEPLTDWELRENARRMSAFALDQRGVDSVAVRKPLAVRMGGLWHGGGDVFGDAADPACRALTAWLDDRGSSADAGAP